MAREKNPLGLAQDPELNETETHETGSEDKYDGEAVDFIKYDHEQFVLPDDFELEDDDDD